MLRSDAERSTSGYQDEENSQKVIQEDAIVRTCATFCRPGKYIDKDIQAPGGSVGLHKLFEVHSIPALYRAEYDGNEFMLKE